PRARGDARSVRRVQSPRDRRAARVLRARLAGALARRRRAREWRERDRDRTPRAPRTRCAPRGAIRSPRGARSRESARCRTAPRVRTARRARLERIRTAARTPTKGNVMNAESILLGPELVELRRAVARSGGRL